MVAQKNKTRAFFLVVCTLWVLLPIQGVQAATVEPSGCIVAAHVSDPALNLYSHVENGSDLFGNLLHIESDCGPYEVSLDGRPISGTSSIHHTLSIPAGTSSITVAGANWSVFWLNLSTLDGSALGEMLDANAEATNALAMSLDDIQTREVWVAIATGLISWLITTTLLSKLITFYIDRHYIEEVID